MKTWHALLLVVLSCGAFVAQERRQRATNDALETELRQLSERVAEGGRKEARAAMVGSQLISRPSAEARPSVETADVTNVSAEPAKPPPEERIARAERAFQRQPIDSTWAIEAQRTISQKLSMLSVENLLVRSFECKSASCRVELGYSNPAAYDAFTNEVLLGPDGPWMGGLYAPPPEKRGDSETVAVVYLMKEGEDLLRAD